MIGYTAIILLKSLAPWTTINKKKIEIPNNPFNLAGRALYFLFNKVHLNAEKETTNQYKEYISGNELTMTENIFPDDRDINELQEGKGLIWEVTKKAISFIPRGSP